MYGRRVPKTHPRVEAYGTVDELNSALGFRPGHGRRCLGQREVLEATQHDLVALMGELAVADEDHAEV